MVVSTTWSVELTLFVNRAPSCGSHRNGFLLALSDVLIFQNSNKIQPIALKKDGTLIFNFTKPVLFSDIGLMDIEEFTQRLIFTYDDGKRETFTYLGFGDNSVQRVIANKRNVRTLEVTLQGAVVELNFCRKC